MGLTKIFCALPTAHTKQIKNLSHPDSVVVYSEDGIQNIPYNSLHNKGDAENILCVI